MDAIDACLEHLAGLHDHRCPRQVLGVRAGLHAADLLGVAVPQRDKRLLAIVETDGCFTSGVTVATGGAVGHRTMRVLDFGKVALTLVDTRAGRAIRVWPHPRARARALDHAPAAESRWHAQLAAYAVMPATELLVAREVVLTLDLEAIISQPGSRAICAACGEEVMNGREVAVGDRAFCRACAGERYYLAGPAPVEAGEHPVAVAEGDVSAGLCRGRCRRAVDRLVALARAWTEPARSLPPGASAHGAASRAAVRPH